MIQEDYVSFETAKLLKEKGFNEECYCYYKVLCGHYIIAHYSNAITNSDLNESYAKIEFGTVPTAQMVLKWLREVYGILMVVDYEYEFTDKSYHYKIYILTENGAPVKRISYVGDNNPHEHIVEYRDYVLSYHDYATYEEACEAGIKYCLENLI